MTEQPFRRLIDIVGEAMERPAEDRESFLQLQCGGDAALLAEARDLVARAGESSLESLTSALEARVGRAAAGAAGPEEGLPRRIGPYKVVRPLGKGGMGVVYLGIQEKPLRREVAIKIIRRGFAGTDAVARFESERQALAVMDHPNIARVYDAGATDDGRPYFVMEPVDGLPITEYCDEERLSLDQRIELFRSVCHAVQHAHYKGVIHRDLKPSNVLVARVDGRAAPKIIDFGIAKATEARLSEESVHTREGVLVGTLDYMSPEQARFDAGNIDTRADVYSLGVILYELVTGRHPFADTTLHTAGVIEAQKIILERDPPRPSTSVDTKERREERARNRSTDSRTLRRRVRADLDWIVMKALEKEPERRYQSALELADDLERYERHEPVAAGPPSVAYRVRKYVRRHRVGVTAAVLVVLALCAGTVATTVGFLRATAEKERAEAVSSFLTGMLASVRPETGDREVTVRQILDASRDRLEAGEFSDDPEMEATLALVIGHSYESLGRYDDAIPLYLRSADLRRQQYGPDDRRVYESLHRLGTAYWKQGDLESALELRLELVETTARTVGKSHPDYAESLSNLANTYADMGDAVVAEGYLREAVEIGRTLPGDTGQLDLARFLNNLGTVLVDQDKYDEAVEIYRETLDIRGRLLGTEHAEYVITMVNLGSAQIAAGQLEDAEATLRRAIELEEEIYGDDHPRTAIAYSNLVTVLIKTGRYEEAEALSRKVISIHIASAGEKYWRVGVERHKLGEILMATGREREAEAELQTAWDILVASQSESSVWARDTAASMARLQERMGNADLAESWALRASAP